MRRSYWRFLCLTVALPLILAACTAAPSGDGSSVMLPSSGAGGASVTETSADASLTGDASETATSPADASEETSSGAAISALSSLTSSKASSATSSKMSSATSSKTSSATSYRTSSTAASSQAVSSVYTPPADTRIIAGKTYQLTFKDEFDGTKLDTTKWAICPAGQRGDDKIKARWDDSMVAVKDGTLVITAKAGSDGTYVCGGVRTLSKNYRTLIWSQCKGYFECRCQLPSATGCIGAFWLMSRGMNNNDVGKGATNGVEIDVLESFSVARGGINHAVHWDGYGAAAQCKDKQIYDRACYTGFHTYGMAWTDDEYIFFVDGKETWRIGNKNVADIVCLEPVYMKLTVEFGSWAGTPVASAFPTQFVVDYVRVYQLAD